MRKTEAKKASALRIVHDRVPNRIRFHIPFIRHQRTLAETLKHRLLRSETCRGIYHAEVNPLTSSLLLKFHGGMHDRHTVTHLLENVVNEIEQGQLEILLKHKNPRLGRMMPTAFFTRELLVNITGNITAALLLIALGLGAKNSRH